VRQPTFGQRAPRPFTVIALILGIGLLLFAQLKQPIGLFLLLGVGGAALAAMVISLLERSRERRPDAVTGEGIARVIAFPPLADEAPEWTPKGGGGTSASTIMRAAPPVGPRANPGDLPPRMEERPFAAAGGQASRREAAMAANAANPEPVAATSPASWRGRTIASPAGSSAPSTPPAAATPVVVRSVPVVPTAAVAAAPRDPAPASASGPGPMRLKLTKSPLPGEAGVGSAVCAVSR